MESEHQLNNWYVWICSLELQPVIPDISNISPLQNQIQANQLDSHKHLPSPKVTLGNKEEDNRDQREDQVTSKTRRGKRDTMALNHREKNRSLTPPQLGKGSASEGQSVTKRLEGSVQEAWKHEDRGKGCPVRYYPPPFCGVGEIIE